MFNENHFNYKTWDIKDAIVFEVGNRRVTARINIPAEWNNADMVTFFLDGKIAWATVAQLRDLTVEAERQVMDWNNSEEVYDKLRTLRNNFWPIVKNPDGTFRAPNASDLGDTPGIWHDLTEL